jgi:hypothetical protein
MSITRDLFTRAAAYKGVSPYPALNLFANEFVCNLFIEIIRAKVSAVALGEKDVYLTKFFQERD